MAAAEFRAEGLKQDLKDAERTIAELNAKLLSQKLAEGDNNESFLKMNEQLKSLKDCLLEKDKVIDKKERLIREYNGDLERERKEKTEKLKRIKDLEKTIEENKYLLLK